MATRISAVIYTTFSSYSFFIVISLFKLYNVILFRNAIVKFRLNRRAFFCDSPVPCLFLQTLTEKSGWVNRYESSSF